MNKKVTFAYLYDQNYNFLWVNRWHDVFKFLNPNFPLNE